MRTEAGGGRKERRRAERGVRWAVGVGLAMWACGFFVARVEGATRPEMAGASSVFVVLFALPSYVSLWRWAGASRALRVLLALGAFALGIEALAVATGWPYGAFSYGDAIGRKVAGLVPWTVPFAWTPLVLGTHALAARAAHKYLWAPQAASTGGLILWGTLALLVADLVLDPGAVRQGFWRYDAGGLYYGVPASNYFGWLLSGVAGHALLLLLLRSPISKRGPQPPHAPPNAEGAPGVGRGLGQALPPPGLAVSLGWTLAFWSSVCAWAGLWAPAAAGHLALLCLWAVLRPPPAEPPRLEPA